MSTPHHPSTLRQLLVLAAATIVAACGNEPDPAVEVAEWNRFASDLVAQDQLPPVQARRMARHSMR